MLKNICQTSIDIKKKYFMETQPDDKKVLFSLWVMASYLKSDIFEVHNCYIYVM